jgi:hypothetical protein
MRSRDAVRRRRELQYNTKVSLASQMADSEMEGGRTIVVASDSLVEAGQLRRGETLVVFVSNEVGL